MIKVFFAYSHNDETDRNELEKHLAVLKREGLLKTWHDRRILAGINIDQEIDGNLLDSNLVLFLVSPDFLASEYCYSKEMQKTIERQKKGLCWAIPIILDHCDWKNTPLKELRACPKDGIPFSEYPNQNKAYNEVVQDIRIVIGEITKKNNKKIIHKDTLNECGQKLKPVMIDPERSSNLRIKKYFLIMRRINLKKMLLSILQNISIILLKSLVKEIRTSSICSIRKIISFMLQFTDLEVR
jgi:hypothetical protein